MSSIGGNCDLRLLKKTGDVVNSIGEKVEKWDNYMTIRGYLDLSSGSSFRETYNSKVQESSHIFICDYVEITEKKVKNLKAECNGKEFDVLLIDNPMELNQHLEIFLKYIGD
ncbi:MAG: head-tail adaptor protein [bacterium]|nr:head-tail adaptor protein [bacterium]